MVGEAASTYSFPQDVGPVKPEQTCWELSRFEGAALDMRYAQGFRRQALNAEIK